MPLFNVTAQPTPLELAATNPRRPVTYFYGVLASQESYWRLRQREAQHAVNLGAHAVATSMVERLKYADQYYVIGMDTNRADSYDTATECRRAALGAVGMSLMMRAINSMPDVEYVDTLAAGKNAAALITDMYDDNRGTNGDDRLHIVAKATEDLLQPSDAPEQWYKRGKLYVLRTAPAQPTETLQFFDQVSGFQTNYAEMVTLFPYMAAA